MAALLTLYEEKINSGALEPDADQARAIIELDELEQLLCLPRVSQSSLRFFAQKKNAAPKGFYFYGGVGRGKSLVMDLFFSMVTLQKKRRAHFHAFMLEVHDFLHRLRNKNDPDHIDDSLLECARHIASEITLLCLDEFQVRDVADAMILGRLFTALLDLGVVIIITSNTAPDNLYEDGLQRDRFLPFIKLLKKKLHIFSFTGKTDYRLSRLKDIKAYFHPHTAATGQELDRIFTALTGREEGEIRTLEIKGRKIIAPKAWGEVAAFSFSELCETQKSALDYIELVKNFKVFIVSDMPVLDDEKPEAVTRFITLIDTLYDQQVQLILSAAAEPEKIYRGEAYAPPFARTVSRLAEMRSEGYKNK